MGTPNCITILRIILIPFLVVALGMEGRGPALSAAAILCVAAFSDWLDGYLARRRGQVTIMGKLLDPVADKLLIISVLIPLVGLGRIPAWMAVVIIGREVAVTGLRAIATSQGIVIGAMSMGKIKMVSQVVAGILLALEGAYLWAPLHMAGMAALWVALAMGLISGAQYLVSFLGKVDPTL